MQALWFFTSDLIFVLLFPQLVFALFDRRANRIGSIAAFSLSLVLRLGGGEPLFGIAPDDPVPRAVLRGPARNRRPAGTTRPPARCCSLTRRSRRWPASSCLPVVSRLTARWDPPRRLRNSGRPTPSRCERPPRRNARGRDDARWFSPGGARLHGARPRVRRRHRRPDRARRRPVVPPGVPADDRRDGHRRHRRLARPAGAREGGAAGLRRPPARRPDRLPDLHVPAAAADLARGPAAGRLAGLAAGAAGRQRVRLLPGRREDRRRLLPRLPVLLERRRASISTCCACRPPGRWRWCSSWRC